MAYENLKQLVQGARDNIEKVKLDGDVTINFRFGSTHHLDGETVFNGLFTTNENGDPAGWNGRSFNDETLNSKAGFHKLLETNISKQKKDVQIG